MDTWKELKKLFEGEPLKKVDPKEEREKHFIRQAAAVLTGSSEESALMNYDPSKMIAFLRLPLPEVKKRLGGEWAEMDDNELRLFLYSVEQKVTKSTSLFDWTS